MEGQALSTTTYTVQRGDTLISLAQRYGLSLEALLAANPQISDPDHIRVGEVLHIPVPAQAILSVDTTLLRAVVPTLSPKRASEVVDALAYGAELADCMTPLRLAMWLAQLAHESGGFRWLRELGDAAYFQRYEGRADLGNTQPGDGARYCGRGFIQITGRTNYTNAAKALNIDLVRYPQFAEVPVIAAMVAAWYWRRHQLNRYADRGDVRGATKAINGGFTGLADREAYYRRAKHALGLS